MLFLGSIVLASLSLGADLKADLKADLEAKTVATHKPSKAEEVEADVVLRGGLILDGTGAAAYEGDLALRGNKIVAVGRFTVARSSGKPRIIDARGLVVAPGFIDLHTHSDTPLQQKDTRANLCYLYQGVTTVVTGNCGSGPADVASYFGTLESGKVGSNVGHLVPHNAIRRLVMKNARRQATREELQRMEELVEQGMKAGAYGLSTGLIYLPGTYANRDELVVLARVVARFGGIYVSHIRDEGVGLLDAIEEALAIGRLANLPVHISHIKVSGRRAWGKSADAISLILQARKKGQVVTADQYPYTASSTSLQASVVPSRFLEGERKDFLARLGDATLGPVIRKAIEEELASPDGATALRIAAFSSRPTWRGKTLAQIAREEKKSALDIVLEIERKGGASVVRFSQNEEDMRLYMKQPWVATASDGSSRIPDSTTVPHPRSYGTFPRKIGHYALTEKVVSLELAVRSASGLPADILKLPRRGYLKKDCVADVVCFDPKEFQDRATYDEPHRYATGVRYLFVNGVAVLDQSKPTGVLPGEVLRHRR